MQKINVIILGGSINSTIAETHIRSLLITRKFKIVGGVFSKKSNINIKTGIDYGLSKEMVFSSLENLFKKINDKIDLCILACGLNFTLLLRTNSFIFNILFSKIS